MTRYKVLKLALDGHGSYLGMEKGCFVIKDRNENTERYPLFENEKRPSHNKQLSMWVDYPTF